MFNPGKRPLTFWISTILAVGLMLLVVACGASQPPPPTAAPTPTPGPPTATPTPKPPTATPTPSAEDHLKQGVEYYEQDKLEEAIVEYEKALELEPGNPNAHRNLGSVYVKQGKWEEAIAAYEQAIKLDPNFGEAYADMVAAYVGLDNLPEAVDAGEKGIKLAPKYATGYNTLGAAYKRQDRLDEATAMFQKAIGIDADYAMPHYNLGLIYYSQGQTDQAIAEWQEAARIDPNHPTTHKNLGVVYFQLKRAAEALDEFKLYLQLAPDAPDRTAVENDMAKLTAQIAASSGETAGQSSPSPSGARPSFMGIDTTRAPGHSIGFESALEPGGSRRFLFLASPGDKVAAGIASSSKMLISIQNAQTGEVIGAVPNNDNSLVVTIPQNALYHIVIEDAGGQGGKYTAAFEASSKVSFALEPDYFIVGRLPEGGLLYYTYTAPGGATLRGSVAPHPDTPIDPVVNIRDLESQAVLAEFNASGPGENEEFTFTVPDSGGKLMTYIVSVEDVDQNKGTYVLSVASDASR
jgi:tetratricopeptide (TPR) repeat protein